MGTAGQFVGFAFFSTLVVGALTSAISLLEVVASSLIDALGWQRRRAALVSGLAITLLGVPSAWSTDFLGVMDGVANNVLLISGGLSLAVFAGWVIKDPMAELRVGAGDFRWFFAWRVMLRFVVPVVLAFVLWNALPATLAAIQGLFAG